MSIPEVGKKIRVTVPSTTANLGPGFDCLGAALDLYNEFIFTRIEGGGDRFDLIMESTDGNHLRGGPENLVFRACLLYTSPSPRDAHESRMPSSA